MLVAGTFRETLVCVRIGRLTKMKLSIAEVKRRLPVGTEYTGEFIGTMNVRVIGNLGVTNLHKSEQERITRRRIVKQTSEMVSEFLDGPKAGQQIYLTWKGVSAQEDTDGSIVLMMDNVEPFLRIRL